MFEMDEAVISPIRRGLVGTRESQQRPSLLVERMKNQQTPDSSQDEARGKCEAYFKGATNYCIVDGYPSGPGSASTPDSDPGYYTTGTTRGREVEDCSGNVPRSYWDQNPYELYAAEMQKSAIPKCATKAATNDVLEGGSRETVFFDNLAIRAKHPNIEPDENRKATEHGSPLSKLDDEEDKDAESPLSSSDDNETEFVNNRTKEQYVNPFMETLKQRLVFQTMAYYPSITMSQPAFTQCGGHRNSTSSRQSTSGASLESTPSKQYGQFGSGTKVWLSSRGQGRQDDHGDDENEDQRPKKRKRGDDQVAEARPKFACPYFQRKPSEHNKHGACSGPGFPTIHRLKEHIYRCHRLPLACSRCGEEFDVEQSLIHHLSLPERCREDSSYTITEDQGMSNEQEKLLRKKAPAHQKEDEKWKEVYKILFPNDDPVKVPSPYFNHQPASPLNEDETPEADIIARYEERCRLELPRIVQGKLEAFIAGEVDVLSERLKSVVLDIVKTSQDELFESVKDSPSSEFRTAGFDRIEPAIFTAGISVPPMEQSERTHSSSSSLNILTSSGSDYTSNRAGEDASKPTQSQHCNCNKPIHSSPPTFSTFDLFSPHSSSEPFQSNSMEEPGTTFSQLPLNNDVFAFFEQPIQHTSTLSQANEPMQFHVGQSQPIFRPILVHRQFRNDGSLQTESTIEEFLANYPSFLSDFPENENEEAM